MTVHRPMLFAFALAAATPAGAADPFFFIPGAPESTLSLRSELATGTRDAGAFGRHGSELIETLRWRAADALVIEARGGVARNQIDDVNEHTASIELRYEFEDSGLTLGAGYRSDYEQVSIPFARLGWRGTASSLPVAVAAVIEAPQADDRDEADVLLSGAMGFACGAAAQCAVELSGEDLEGFVDTEEAEGGAKFLLGPTAAWRWSGARQLKVFAGWIHAATANEPRRDGFADYRGRRDGVMARVAFDFGI